MNAITTFAFLVIGTVLVVFWLYLYKTYIDSYDDIIESIDPEQYKMPELFFIGFGAIEVFKVNLKSEKNRKKQKMISELYGERYAEYYHYCMVGGQFTYGLTVAPLAFLFGAMSGDITYAMLIGALGVFLVIYLDKEIETAVEKKRDEILIDFPEVLSKLTLLVNAGLVLREAWAKVAYTSDRPMYKEMQIACDEMNNGISDVDAFYNFSQRCAIKEVRKFASVLIQNVQKGGTELAKTLRFMTDESWEEKKHRAKRKGEAAGDKLMAPMMIMFGGIIMMIIIPLFASML